MFNHNYIKEFKNHSKPEINSGETLVETAGYIPAKKKIENMILAGQRLVEYRKSQFDFEDHKSIDEDYYDPTRNKNLDMAEAFQMSDSATRRLKAFQKAQDELKKDEKGVKPLESEKSPE